ncbi:MAG: S9 family peptidase [Rhodospirillaceae bacterium]|nr:S9 family peptidase [Rhodospirillaceae bacterium]
MRRTIILALAFSAASGMAGAFAVENGAAPAGRIERGPLVTENIPITPPALADRLRQYANTRSAGVADWRPDGAALLIATRFGEAAQLHQVTSALGARHQLTYYDEPIGSGAYSADGKRIVFMRDVGGSEDFQIFIQDLGTGRAEMVSDGKSRHTTLLMSPDRTRFAFASNRRNGKDMDIYVADMAAPNQPRLLYEAAGSWSPESWSADGTQLAITQYISISESRIVLVNARSGAAREIKAASGEGKAALGSPEFGATSDQLFFTSDKGTEFTQLRMRDLRNGTERNLSADTPWDVTVLKAAPDGAVLAYVINEDGVDRLRLLDTATLQTLPAPNLPDGQIGRMVFSPDGRKLAFGLTTDVSPSDVYVYDIAAKTLTRWTESEVGGLNPESFVPAVTVRYPTFDRTGSKVRQIPARVYKPKNKPGPFPVIVQIHGGPEGQERAGFVAETQAFVNELGAAVIKPNVRGSTGYGKTFHQLDNAAKREDSVKDIGALLDWIGTQRDLDAKRVVVYGGSYGGFMVLASMVRYNDRLAGGIDVVGISNFTTFLTNTRGYRQDLRRAEYGDERDMAMRAVFERISPLNNASRITKPMMIVQGLNDPRVPVTESEQMLSALKRAGGKPWYMLGKDEGHGFRKKSNRAAQQEAGFLFLDQVFSGATN